MQDVVQQVLQGSVRDSQHVLNMSIGTLQNTEYTINDDDMMNLFDILAGFYDGVNNVFEDPRVLAIGRLVACSKDLSLRFLSQTSHKINNPSTEVIYQILDFQADDSDVMHQLCEMIKIDIRRGRIDIEVYSIIEKIPNFVLDNFDFLLETYSLDYEVAWHLLTTGDYFKSVPDELFLKICEIYASENENSMEELAIELLEKTYQHRERPIHYGVIEKLMEYDHVDIVSVSAEDLFTLMQKYPSRIELLDISTPSISGNEIGFEHCVKFVETHFNTNTMEKNCYFLMRFEDISSLGYLLLEHLDDHEVQNWLRYKYKTLGPYLPKVVDFFLKEMSDFSLEFLVMVYKLCDNKEEIKEKVLILVANCKRLYYREAESFLDMLDGDLPIMNRRVYEKCIHALLDNSGLVQCLSPRYTEIMINYFFENNLVNDLFNVCRFRNVREFDHLIVDLIIRSSNQLLQSKLWDFANVLGTNYAIDNAYVYGYLNVVDVESAFLEKWKRVPDDYEVPNFIRNYLNGNSFPSGELLASVCNKICCEIQIDLIKLFTYKALNDEFRSSAAFSLAQELSLMVLKLNKIDHKKELRTILVRCMLGAPKEMINKDIVIRAIERLGGGDECHELALMWGT